MELDPTHPKQELLFFVEGDLDDTIVRGIRDLINSMAQQRTWIVGPPRLVDEVESPRQSDVDQLLHTVGGTFEVYSALPPWGARLPPSVDRARFEEVKFIVERLEQFSAKTKSEIAFELDGVQVGWIEEGVPCRSLREAFLGEWERSLKP